MSSNAVDLIFWSDQGCRRGRSSRVRRSSKKDDPATELYIIQSGRVEIQYGNRLLDTLEEHNIFGEMALIDSAPRSATAVASTDVVLIPVSEKQFLFLVSETPFFALMVMRVLAQRLRAANAAI